MENIKPNLNYKGKTYKTQENNLFYCLVEEECPLFDKNEINNIKTIIQVKYSISL